MVKEGDGCLGIPRLVQKTVFLACEVAERMAENKERSTSQIMWVLQVMVPLRFTLAQEFTGGFELRTCIHGSFW